MMSKKDFIQVFEHHKLKYDESSDFKKHHFDAMVLFNEKNQNKYFTIVYKGVLFNSYVGVIQIGGLTIEILPKADNSDNPDKGAWQNVLLNMLKICKHIKVDNVSETNLNKKYNSLLDVYFEMYLNEVDGLIKRGLIKKYRSVQSNQLALKGKVLFAQNIQSNVIHKERFFCEHQVYDKEHLLHQIIFKALKVLDKLINNHLRDKLNRILFELYDFKEININVKHFDKINLNRKSQSYQRAIDIAKMLILNYSPNLNSGNDNMLTLLFDMNKLWEEYIYRILQKYMPENYTISFQNSEIFWEHKTIRPDIVIKDDKKEKFVIDTKWKVVDSNNPSDNDLKQMFTYNLLWKAEKCMLLYPRVYQRDSEYGDYIFKRKKKAENKCKLGFVSVLDNGILRENKDVAKEIFQKL
jgi:5-methylcytosine-specific restriction enzyme subunit McrC